MQDGIVLWDGRSSKDCRVGLSVPQELADAIRYVDCYSSRKKKETRLHLSASV